MKSRRLDALSDGVIAIVITIMVLELDVPQDATTFRSLSAEVPDFLAYVLSFVHLGIYWNNHHHMLAATDRVTGKILWANHHLLFWLSLFPFCTRWIAREFEPVPAAAYGVVLFFAAVAYHLLQRAILAEHEKDSVLAKAVRRDWKGKVSMLGYMAAIPLAVVHPAISIGIYVILAATWIVPDRRIEEEVEEA